MLREIHSGNLSLKTENKSVVSCTDWVPDLMVHTPNTRHSFQAINKNTTDMLLTLSFVNVLRFKPQRLEKYAESW